MHFPIRRLSLFAALTAFVAPIHAEPAVAPAPPAAPEAPAPGKKPHNYAQWEKAIAEFEKKDAASPPPKNAVLFLGSSTIQKWKTLAEDFPELTVINRGFGGNEITDSTFYAEKIIFPYAPRLIVLRAGSNDIHAGRTPEEVAGDFKTFVEKVRSRLPKTPIAYVTQCPTVARWSERGKLQQLDTLVAAYAKSVGNVRIIDVTNIAQGPDDKPRLELFESDKLHLNREGYKLLAAAMHEGLK